MIPKSRIRLSRSLRSQVTPYPNAGKLIKRAGVLGLILAAAGILLLTQKKPAIDNSPSPKQILGEQEATAKPQFTTYKIKRGDTLFNISQNFEISWQTLAEINGLQEPYTLKVGQEIKIPRL